jgi:hypothetical protein
MFLLGNTALFVSQLKLNSKIIFFTLKSVLSAIYVLSFVITFLPPNGLGQAVRSRRYPEAPLPLVSFLPGSPDANTKKNSKN